MKIYSLLFSLLLAVTSHSWATTFASDGSPTSIQTFHSQAVNGDTITLPAGTFTWTTGVTLSKGITLQGAGIGQTIIRDSITGGVRIVLWTLPNSASASRITGIEFQE